MLFGNLGADPELRAIASGGHVLSFRVATTEVWFDKQQQKQERTEWHQVALFGARAEPLAKLLHKGSRVLVEGRLQTTSYDKEGSKRYRTEVVATDLFLGGTASSGNPPLSSSLGSAAGRESPGSLRARPLSAVGTDNDIPF